MTGRQRLGSEELYVLYDEHCVLCTGTVKRLKGMRSYAVLHYVPLQTLERREPQAAAIPGWSRLDPLKLYEKLHIIDKDGVVYAGADGIIRIMRTVPGMRWLSWLYAVPGMKAVGDTLYRYIARRRYDWFGRTDEGCADGASCRLPGPIGGDADHGSRHR